MGKSGKVLDTAYWAASVRVHSHIIHDEYAHSFIEHRQSQLAKFSHLKRPALAMAVCHRAIDEHLIVQLGLDPGSQIVLIGAGFDTRAYRLNGGLWFEIDDRELIAEKDDTLPARSAKNPLLRIGVDFEAESLEQVILGLPLKSDCPVVVVLEGVINYLREDEILAVLEAVTERYAGAVLIMDIMSSAFLNRFATGFRHAVAASGMDFRFLPGDPDTFIRKHGYTVMRRTSILEKGEEYGTARIPGWIKKLFLHSMVTGYCIYFVRRMLPGAAAVQER